MSLLVNLSRSNKFLLRASVLTVSLIFGILLFNAFAASPVHIDEIEKPAYVQMEYSFPSPDNYYPEIQDDLATNTPPPWAVDIPYTNILTSPTTGVMFVHNPEPVISDGDAFYHIVSTDYAIKPTDAEREVVKKVWDGLPEWTCFNDALIAIAMPLLERDGATGYLLHRGRVILRALRGEYVSLEEQAS